MVGGSAESRFLLFLTQSSALRQGLPRRKDLTDAIKKRLKLEPNSIGLSLKMWPMSNVYDQGTPIEVNRLDSMTKHNPRTALSTLNKDIYIVVQLPQQGNAALKFRCRSLEELLTRAIYILSAFILRSAILRCKLLQRVDLAHLLQCY